jgi:hypothetical protein
MEISSASRRASKKVGALQPIQLKDRLDHAVDLGSSETLQTYFSGKALPIEAGQERARYRMSSVELSSPQ